jgi:hypothetical protein
MERRQPELEAKRIDRDIATVKGKIEKYDSEIKHAVTMREHHPWHWDRERFKFQSLRNVELQRLAGLIDQRKQAGAGRDDGDRLSSGAFFMPRGSF